MELFASHVRKDKSDGFATNLISNCFRRQNVFWISTRCACSRLSFFKFSSPSSSLSTIKTFNKLPSRDGTACGPDVKYRNWTVKLSIKSNEQSNAVEAQLSLIMESKYQIRVAQQTRKFAISWHLITLDVKRKSSKWLNTQQRGSLICPSSWLSLRWSESFSLIQ